MAEFRPVKGCSHATGGGFDAGVACQWGAMEFSEDITAEVCDRGNKDALLVKQIG
ncbi:hypothetical protein Scep_025602 [Stephania cephalantha]|uniref:Uncharacterized protein n=1 Tax=Stephania cephalantha TaxID=152367 RepID=A0AAP0EQV3_9MAGN